MNSYETVFIIDDTIKEEQKKNVIARIENFINNNGKITHKETIGSRKLAYEIRKNKTGYYHIIKFKAKPNTIQELERTYRITDEVLKFIVVKQEN